MPEYIVMTGVRLPALIEAANGKTIHVKLDGEPLAYDCDVHGLAAGERHIVEMPERYAADFGPALMELGEYAETQARQREATRQRLLREIALAGFEPHELLPAKEAGEESTEASAEAKKGRDRTKSKPEVKDEDKE